MLGFSQEFIWFGVVFYDLLLAVFLFRYYGKYGLYCAVILGIILANLQGGKITELTMFGTHLMQVWGLFYIQVYIFLQTY